LDTRTPRSVFLAGWAVIFGVLLLCAVFW